MAALFFQAMVEGIETLAIISAAAYLTCALAILLFHVAIHKPLSDGGKIAAVIGVVVALGGKHQHQQRGRAKGLQRRHGDKHDHKQRRDAIRR